MIPPVCFITDAGAPAPVTAQVRAAVRAGVRLIQLRDKTATDAAMIEEARRLRRMIRPYGARLVVNDRVEVAIAAGADGLHVGQHDGDPRSIRARIGDAMLLGLSIEVPAQIETVPPQCVDYLGVGPIRATASKADHAAPLGMSGLAEIARMTDLPVMAIGGLGVEDTGSLRAAGASGVAVVSAISRAPDMERAAQDLVTEWSRT